MKIIILICLVIFYFIFNEAFIKNEKDKRKATLLMMIDLGILMTIWLVLEKVFLQYGINTIDNLAFYFICILAAVIGYKYKLNTYFSKSTKLKSN